MTEQVQCRCSHCGANFTSTRGAITCPKCSKK